jgi:hypothetical protein
MGSQEAVMDATMKDWLVVGCAIASLCASLSVLVMVCYACALPRYSNPVRLARRDTYVALLELAARVRDRFQSAAIRQKLQRLQPANLEILAYVDEDLSSGWIAFEELGQKLQAHQLICSDKIISLISDARSNHFYNAESLFKVYGHAALDVGALHKHAQDLATKLKQRCKKEIGLGTQ